MQMSPLKEIAMAIFSKLCWLYPGSILEMLIGSIFCSLQAALIESGDGRKATLEATNQMQLLNLHYEVKR